MSILGKRVRTTIEGVVVAEVAQSLDDPAKTGKVAVFVTVPGSAPDIHFGHPGVWVWVLPDEVEEVAP